MSHSSGNDFYGQKVAAEAAAGCLSALGKVVCAAGNEDECVGIELPVLGRFLSGCMRERDRVIRLISTERQLEERKDGCCFLGWAVR